MIGFYFLKFEVFKFYTLKFKQDLGTVLRYCSLGSIFKILSCEFFLKG